MRYLVCSAIAVLTLALATAPTVAPMAAEVAWEEELGTQIRSEENCEVAFLSEVVRRQLDDKTVTMAKVHCEDKRSFDAFRKNDGEPFEIRECEVPDVSTC